MATARPIAGLAIAERPLVQIRMLNHWDNLDGSIERGYAGRSLWQWDDLPAVVSPRYREYARANASVGINGASVNNVNADARILTPDYLRKVAALANIWRPYGVRMYLSINFAAPVTVGGMETADPLDEGVAGYWEETADEIYSLIPDFGGFLVKANSEGQPGPKDYGRSHAEGANAMARALAPHGGNVIWRAFIYDAEVDPDRANRPYIEFMRLEGDFEPNVLVQIKNGARRLPAARAVPPALRRIASDPGHGGAAADAGVSRSGSAPGLSGHDVGGIPHLRHSRRWSGLNRRPVRGRRGLADARHRHGRRDESRARRQLVRAPFQPVELVRLRPDGVEP